MNRTTRHLGRAAAAASLVIAASAAGVAAQNPVHAHIRHAADGFRGTPDGMGLLPTAVAEAEIAHQHATLAGRDPTNLEGMQRHMAHVIHALDPAEAEGGPGLGYGAIAGAEGAARHSKLAAASQGASDAVNTHANHVATAALSAAEHARQAFELAGQIQEAESAEAAAELLEQLTMHTDAVLNGTDADGDGRVGWQEPEGGLAQAVRHMGLMKQAEGLDG